MTQTETHLQRIYVKLQELLKVHAMVLRENKQLSEAKKKMDAQQLKQEQFVEMLKQKIMAMQLNAATYDSSEKKTIEKKINQYVKAIDDCIANFGK